MTRCNHLITAVGRGDRDAYQGDGKNRGPLFNLLNSWSDVEGVHILVDKKQGEDSKEFVEIADNLISCLDRERPDLLIKKHDIYIKHAHDYEGGYVELRRVALEVLRDAGDVNLAINLAAGLPVWQTIWFLLVYSGQVPGDLLHPRRSADVERYGGEPVLEVGIPLKDFPRVEAPYGKAFLESALRRKEISRRASLEELQEKAMAAGVIFESEAMAEVVAQLLRFAPNPEPVLLLGEPGVGKEGLAKLVHHYWCESRSNVSGKPEPAPCISINCGAIAPGLLQSEFFGHEQGAFPGAHQRHHGAFEQADGGTLFLDEIGVAIPETQTALLRAIQEKTIRRVGGQEDIHVDVRVIAATNADPKEKLRPDLYYRLNTFEVEIPPLRKRPDDILPLARHSAHSKGRDPAQAITRELERELLRRPWPGNIRQLENEIIYAVVIADRDEPLTPAHLPSGDEDDASRQPEVHLPPDGIVLEKILEALKGRYIEEAMRRTGDNKAKASRLLGCNERYISNWLRSRGRA